MKEGNEEQVDGGGDHLPGKSNHHCSGGNGPGGVSDNVSVGSYSSSLVQTDPPEDNTITLSPEATSTHRFTTTSTMTMTESHMPYGELSW